MALYTVAQRRSFFQRALEGVGDVGRFFSKDEDLKGKVSIIRDLDQRIREVCLTHGVNQQSLKHDLISAKRELQANNLLEANRYLYSFNMALQSVVTIAAEAERVKTAGEFEELYGEALAASKEGLEQLLQLAEDTYYVTLAPLFNKLDQARSSANVEQYLMYLSELVEACNTFNKFYQEAYHQHVKPVLDYKARHQAFKDVAGKRVREEMKEMVDELYDVKGEDYAKECQCGSGKAYLVCCGLDMNKIYSIMKRERALGSHITLDQAMKLYIQEFNRNIARRAEKEAKKQMEMQEAEAAAKKEEAMRERMERRERMAPVFEEAFGKPKKVSQRKEFFKLISS